MRSHRTCLPADEAFDDGSHRDEGLYLIRSTPRAQALRMRGKVEASRSEPSGRRVLIVEDDLESAELLQGLLDHGLCDGPVVATDSVPLASCPAEQLATNVARWTFFERSCAYAG